MSKVGPKELAQRELQAKKLSRAHEMMLEDGCPPKCLRTGDGPKLKRRDDDRGAGVTLAPPIAVQKALAKEFAEDEPETTNAPAPPVAEQQEMTMAKKPTKKQTTKKIAKLKKTALKKPTARGGVSPLDVATFICRDGGASMDELVKKFDIDAHPMRSKVHAARHKLGYAIERRDGRFFGTAPR